MEAPFHTYIDYLRNDEDREINHHGTTIKPNQEDEDPVITHVLPAHSTKINEDLISRNEKTQVSALKNHYSELEKKRRTNEKKLKRCLKFAHVYNPIAALTFVSVYWILGLREAEYF